MEYAHLHVDISLQINNNQTTICRPTEVGHRGRDWGEHIDLPGRGKWNTFYWRTAGGWGQEWRGGYEDEKWHKQRESARIEEPVRGSGSPNIYASNLNAVSK